MTVLILSEVVDCQSAVLSSVWHCVEMLGGFYIGLCCTVTIGPPGFEDFNCLLVGALH